jgi:Redoxin
MGFLVAALVLVGALGMLNLVFTFGVIRRLREHTELFNRLGTGTAVGGGDSAMTEAGGRIGEFAASTEDGEPVSRDLLAGSTLVGFFSPTCAPCIERLPEFAEYARMHMGGRGQTLAVVVSDDDEAAAPLVTQLAGVARVVRDVRTGRLQAAFGVRGLPVVALIGPDGVVAASGRDLSALPLPAA